MHPGSQRRQQRPAPATASPSGTLPQRTVSSRRLLSPLLLLGTGLAFVTGFQAQQRLSAAGPSTRLAQANGRDASYVASGEKPPSISGKAGSERNEDAAASLETFQTVYDLIHEHYVDALPADRQLSYGTVRAMLKQLGDPNCFFLEPEQREIVENEARGRFAGIGASILVRAVPHDGYSDSRIVIVAPLPDSPAAHAGLHSGDIVTHIDGKWILGADPYLRYNRLVQKAEESGSDSGDDTEIRKEEESARRRVQGGIGLIAAQLALRGDIPTLTHQKMPVDKLTLTVERPGQSAPIKITVTPGATDAAPPSARLLADGSGYIRVTSLAEKTAGQFRDALVSLKSPQGIVLDLRGCAGGAGGGFPVALDAAEGIAGSLAPNGTAQTFALETLGGGKTATLRTPAAPPAAMAVPSGKPALVVLVDNGTAAAGEALASALASRSGATLAGGRTFGDPYVQSLIRLKDGSAFLLTTGRLYGPDHTDWATKGLIPAEKIAAGTPDEMILARAVRLLHNAKASRIALGHPAPAPKSDHRPSTGNTSNRSAGAAR